MQLTLTLSSNAVSRGGTTALEVLLDPGSRPFAKVFEGLERLFSHGQRSVCHIYKGPGSNHQPPGRHAPQASQARSRGAISILLTVGGQTSRIQALQDWIEQSTGTRVTGAERIFSGGSRQTILVDTLKASGEPLPLVLKWEPGVGSHAGTDFLLEREYVVYRALEKSAVPVPKAYGISDDGNALLMEGISRQPLRLRGRRRWLFRRWRHAAT